MPDLLIPILIGLLLLVILGLALWMGAQLRALKPHPDDQKAIAELKGQVGAFAMQVENLRQSLTTQQSQVIQSLTTTRDAMDKRLDGAARTMAEVSKNLGQLTVATKQLEEVGKDISSLQDILRAPKLRGNLGELFLGDLLAQILPTEHFELQYGFKGGEAVDAVVKLNAGLVPVDAKFPLESFKRILATESDEAKKAPRREFIRDVKKHVDAIADKYIRPDEGTFDFALMYIPAENVYYETIIKDDEFGGDSALFEYALNRRVIPVSPNSFYAYLQTVLLGLKGMRIEDSVREVIDQLARVHVELNKFCEDFRVLGNHLNNSRSKYEEAQKRLDTVSDKLAQIEGVVQPNPPPRLP